jgi:hypothetical protein
MLNDIDLSSIQEENARELVGRLLNIIETLSADLREAQAENQRLRDEINRLKGEQGKPKIKGNTPKPPCVDHSSEKERQKRHRHSKDSKKGQIVITRQQVVEVDCSELPSDAEFKGYEDVVVQDIVLSPDNVCFRKQKYYAASTGKTYLAQLPKGYAGQFGPGIKALVLTLYFGGQMTEPKILEFLRNIGVQISDGKLSNLLVKDQDDFHAEKDAVYEAGLSSSPWQHTDDTQTRVNGQNQHCHVVCNPVYSAYYTRPTKERLAVLDVLRNGRERIFRLNQEAMGYLENVQMSKTAWHILQTWAQEQDMNEAIFLDWLDQSLPMLSKQARKTIIDAAAIAAYHAQKDFPVVRTLICDDAPQFNWLTETMMLCWIHEGRPYKKLVPVFPLHQALLKEFLKSFWEYYDQLLAYRQDPTEQERERLDARFDELFSTHTGYTQLDQRIAKTQAKKASLLLVLEYPELPLHNNPAELAVRQRVRKRDISFGPRTQNGARAWDTFMTLAETTKKLGVSFYQYIHDRISRVSLIPPLADLVTQRAKALNLGWSWIAPEPAPTY